MNGNNSVLKNSSSVLLDTLKRHTGEIVWSSDVIKIYEMLHENLTLVHELNDETEAINSLENNLLELENYLFIDIERHLVKCNGNKPHYAQKLKLCLQRIYTKLQQQRSSDGVRKRKWFHLAAKLQAICFEFGFCSSIEPITDISEIRSRIEHLMERTQKIEEAMNGQSMNGQSADKSPSLINGKSSEIAHKIDLAAITELHYVIAQQNGIKQSSTESNMEKVDAIFNNLSDRISSLEKNYFSYRFLEDTSIVADYIENQNMLRKPYLENFLHVDFTNIITSHMIHPATRDWMLTAIYRFIKTSERQIFFIASKAGCGKTAIAAQICKSFPGEVVACHFFQKQLESDTINTIEGLIISLASSLTRSLPEYLKYMDDEFGRNDSQLKSHLRKPWRYLYDILINKPFTTLYGRGGNRNSSRKMIVIDALDECTKSNWTDLSAFLTSLIKDMPPCICFFLSIRTKFYKQIIPSNQSQLNGIYLDEKPSLNRHIKDLEVYIASCLGAILSGEDELEIPEHSRNDNATVQNITDDLLKQSSGRFDYAINLMEYFTKAMAQSNGQFLTSAKKAKFNLKDVYGNEYENRTTDFASPFRSYREREGRSVQVRIQRQSLYPMDKARVALIRRSLTVED